MADNTTISAGSGGDVIASDDVTTLNGAASSGVKVQRVKVGYGDDGSHRDISSAYPLPVNLSASLGNAAQVAGALTAASASATTGTAGTTTSTVTYDVAAAGNISFHLLATAFVGTVVFEQSFDPAGSAASWAPVPVNPEDLASAPASTLAINTAVAYIRQFTQDMFGPRLFRIRCSAFTSGSLAVLGSPGPGWYAANPVLAPSTAQIGSLMLAQTAPAAANSSAAAATPPASLGTGLAYLTGTAVQAATALVNAPAAGTSIYVTDVVVGNSGSTLTVVTLLEGTTTTRLALPAAASGGGGPVNLRTPWKLPAATALGIAVSAATTSWYASVSYYVAP